MEGQMFGWKKSIKQYHYFESDSMSSLCNQVTYANSSFKQLVFYDDTEIVQDMMVCPACYTARQTLIRNKIKDRFKNEEFSEKGFAVKEVKCSDENCNVRGLAIIFSIENEKPHYCLIHNPRIQQSDRQRLRKETV